MVGSTELEPEPAPAKKTGSEAAPQQTKNTHTHGEVKIPGMEISPAMGTYLMDLCKKKIHLDKDDSPVLLSTAEKLARRLAMHLFVCFSQIYVHIYCVQYCVHAVQLKPARGYWPCGK